MSISNKRTDKYRKTFVKVFQSDIKNIQDELNSWIKENEEDFEIVDIKLSSDCQSKAVAMVVFRHVEENKE